MNDAAQRAAERIAIEYVDYVAENHRAAEKENIAAIIREETAADVAELVAALEHLLDVPNPMAADCNGCKHARAVLAKHR
jgi:hypothetical protein